MVVFSLIIIRITADPGNRTVFLWSPNFLYLSVKCFNLVKINKSESIYSNGEQNFIAGLQRKQNAE